MNFGLYTELMFYARNQEELFEKIISQINLELIKPYLTGCMFCYCHICMNNIKKAEIVREDHSHDDIEYEEEYLKSYIRSKTLFTKLILI